MGRLRNSRTIKRTCTYELETQPLDATRCRRRLCSCTWSERRDKCTSRGPEPPSVYVLQHRTHVSPDLWPEQLLHSRERARTDQLSGKPSDLKADGDVPAAPGHRGEPWSRRLLRDHRRIRPHPCPNSGRKLHAQAGQCGRKHGSPPPVVLRST